MRQETEKMVEIAKEAGKIAMKYWTELKDHHISMKDDGSLLTIADTEVDQYIRCELENAFPEYSVLSEESKNERTTDGVFIIDPIDGTKNFSQGDTNFGISIGLIINNQPEIGVIYGPAINKMYVGENQGGAFCNDEEIHVSDKESIDGMKVLLHEGRREVTKVSQKIVMGVIEKENVEIERIKTCASLDMCRVAEGSYDAFIHRGLDAWDIVAGIVILEAAGGIACHLDGSTKNLFEKNIIATNPKLKDKIVALTKNC